MLVDHKSSKTYSKMEGKGKSEGRKGRLDGIMLFVFDLPITSGPLPLACIISNKLCYNLKVFLFYTLSGAEQLLLWI